MPPPATRWASDAEAAAIGEQLLARTLPKEAWTHAAHLTAAVYLLRRRPDLHLERDLPGIIQAYNQVIGVRETALRGYHETLTQFYIRAVRHFLSRTAPGAGLAAVCNQLIASPFGERDFPLTFYSRELLFSMDAKLCFVEPDLRPLAFGDIPTERAASPPRSLVASPAGD